MQKNTKTILAFGLLSVVGVSTLIATNFADASELTDKRTNLRNENRAELRIKNEERKELHTKMNREVTQIDNGIIMTVTTDDQDLLEKMRTNTHAPKCAMENVVVDKIDLDNGFQVTITTDNPETLEKIQNHEGKGFGSMSRSERRMQNK